MSHVRIEEMLAESGLAREEMADVVDLLLPLEDLVDDAPAPSAELAALLGPERPRTVARVGSRRSAVAGALVLALSGVGATGLSAAANTLPRPLQHQVSQFSQNYLPFDLPEPPAPHRRSQGLPELAPAPTGERGGATSRSTPGRQSDPAAIAPPAPTAHAQPSPTAQATSSSTAQPGAAPSYATESAGPSPSMQPFATTSPSPSGRPHDGSGKGHPSPSPDPGQDDKGKGHGTAPGKGTDPGTGQGNKPGQGNGGQSPTPSPSAPVPTTPTVPAPQPDPPLPTVPLLPDPLPGLGTIGDTGPVDTGPVGTN